MVGEKKTGVELNCGERLAWLHKVKISFIDKFTSGTPNTKLALDLLIKAAIKHGQLVKAEEHAEDVDWFQEIMLDMERAKLEARLEKQ